jgi:hypothetical protein
MTRSQINRRNDTEILKEAQTFRDFDKQAFRLTGHTVKATNFAPCGNFTLFFQNNLTVSEHVLQKNKEMEV